MNKEPDKYHRHEALHMAIFLAESVEGQLVDNAFVKNDQECKALADKACELLHDLYQAIGAKHFED